MVCARVIECLLNTTSCMFGVCQVMFLQMKSVLLIDVDARSEQGLMAPARVYGGRRSLARWSCSARVCVGKRVSKGVHP